MPTNRVRSERQLGLLWGGVAALLVMLSPWADSLASSLPACPVKSVTQWPCPACGTTRAAVALSHLDPLHAFFVNPLAALAWVALIGGGAVAGVLALGDRPMREPDWRLSRTVRWLMVVGLLANWIYLVGVDV